jgi:endonuclease III
MNKIQFILSTLDSYFPDPAIPLHHKDPYTLLIAVMLSARCTDERVNEVTPALFLLADTPEKMAQLSWQEIQAIIRPCGLSEKKAKGILETSQILSTRFCSKVPSTFEELEALPRVGHKTASVVLCQAFNIPAFPVDTHILRLARRWSISKGKTPDRVEKDLKKTFPKEVWIKTHLQMIYFGRAFCSARGHTISQCPMCSWLASNPHTKVEHELH